MNEPPSRSRSICVAMALTFVVTMMSTTLPTPLYPVYQQRLGLSELMITVIFAAYAVGAIGALISTGRWSDQIGSRLLLAIGLGFSAASAIVFLWDGSLTPLLVARTLSGISAGIYTGTATVAVVEMAPAVWAGSATLIATAANMGGLGLGPLFAGLLARYLPWPLHLSYAIDLVLIVLAAAAIWRLPETAECPQRPKLRMQLPRVPAEVLGVFVPAAIAGFAGFAVLGLFMAAVPAFMGKILNISNHALTGAVVFLVFVASTTGQLGQDYLPKRGRLALGCLGLIAGMVLLGLALVLSSLTLLIVAAVVAGMAHGVAFRAGMGAITQASPLHRRGEVASTYFVMVYIAISIPVVGLGVVAGPLGLETAGLIFAAADGMLAVAAMLILQFRRIEQTSYEGSTHETEKIVR